MLTQELLEKPEITSRELAIILKPYDDESAVTLLLCAVVGVSAHGKISPAQVIKTFLELRSVLEEPEELMN